MSFPIFWIVVIVEGSLFRHIKHFCLEYCHVSCSHSLRSTCVSCGHTAFQRTYRWNGEPSMGFFCFQTFMELSTITVPNGVGPTMNVYKKGRLGMERLPIHIFCPLVSKLLERGNYCIWAHFSFIQHKLLEIT